MLAYLAYSFYFELKALNPELSKTTRFLRFLKANDFDFSSSNFKVQSFIIWLADIMIVAISVSLIMNFIA